MKRPKPKTLEQHFLPPGAHKSESGLNGPPPSGIDPNCFHDMCNPRLNGELWFWHLIKPYITRVYDVGADTTHYQQFYNGEIHYFEPIEESNIFEAKRLILEGNNVLYNKESYFNNFGLSEVTSKNLKISWHAGDVSPNPNGKDIYVGDNIYMKTKRGDEYMEENEHKHVDFLTIDTDGHEFGVIKGFGDRIKDINMIQFEHGGTTYSAGYKLSEIIEYLKSYDFWGFSYLATRFEPHPNGVLPVNYMVPLCWNKNSEDHYAYCNIVCTNKRFLDHKETIVDKYPALTPPVAWQHPLLPFPT